MSRFAKDRRLGETAYAPMLPMYRRILVGGVFPLFRKILKSQRDV
jgi:hypothetical protein